jgi:predicted metalloprotease
MTRLLRSMVPVAVLVLSSACEDTVVDPLPPVQVTNPTTPTNPTAPKDSDGDGIPDSMDRCPTQRETRNGVFDSDGCPDSPLDLYAAVRTDVEQFWSGYFTTVIRRPYTPLTAAITFSGGTIATPCGPGQGPFYCPTNLTTYLDLKFLQAQLTKIGDFAPAIIIAHEIGHHTQRLLGISSSGALSIQLELQADCLAGRWAASAAQRGFLEPGDIQEALRSLFTVGDPAGTPWFAPGAHGTSFQRQAAFQQGLNNLAC